MNHDDSIPSPVRDALGQSEEFLQFQERLSRVAKVDRPVLVIGERGTGKEMAASRIHYLSPRWQEPFFALNCAALPPSLIESELFGHEEGAFTGASRKRVGRFESASGGTLFLDEIGMIPIEAQEKILRVVEYGTFERVGGSVSVKVDVRLVAATNADMKALVRSGRFKHDLLDRISFDVLFVPPLRHRREDILLLANHFATRMAFDLGWDSLPEFTDAAVEMLENYPWPGNVRELKNVIERAVYRSDDALITAEEVIFDPFQSPYGAPPVAPGQEEEAPYGYIPTASSASGGPLERLLREPLPEALRQLEVLRLREAMHQAQYNQRKAADSLGLTYHQFRGLYRKHQESLEPPLR